jgi:hypothetical protein
MDIVLAPSQQMTTFSHELSILDKSKRVMMHTENDIKF